MWPARSIDLVVKKLNAGKMAAWTARLLHPMRCPRRGTAGRVGFDLAQQTASVEALDSRDRQSPQPEGSTFQG
jgi:hypothetical protein